MKTKLLVFALLFSTLSKAQITKKEAFTTGTKLSFYPNQCGNTIPEAAGKLTFCDRADNLGVVERSYGLNDRRAERMLPNHFNGDEVYVTGNGVSIRNTNGTWENIPNIAIPTYNTQGDWTNVAKAQNGLVLPDGKIIIQSTNGGAHVYDRALKTFALINFPNNRHPQLFVHDSNRNLTWIVAFNSSNRYLYAFNGSALSFVADLPTLQSVSISVNSANLIYNNDFLYLGSNNGLHKIDVSNYTSPPLAVTSYHSTTTPNLPFNRVNDLQFDANNVLWMANSGTNGGGIVKFNIANETYDLYETPIPDNAAINIRFNTLALDETGLIWAVGQNYGGLVKLTFSGNTPNWTLLPSTDLTALGAPITYNPNNIYFRNDKFYFTTTDFSSGSNNNFEVIINDDDVWSGRNDNESGNLSRRMNNRFTNVQPDENGGVWWFNRHDNIVVYRDANDNHQSMLIDNLQNTAAIDTDNKAIVKGGSPNELRKIDFPNANSIQNGINQANNIKRVADQIWVFDRGIKKIDAYKNGTLLNTYNLDEDWYSNAFHFAADDNGDAWFIRHVNGSIEIKKFNTTSLTTTTYNLSSIGSLSTLRKVVSAPNGGMWFLGTLGALYQENGMFYDFKAADHPEIYNLYDIVVDTNGKAYLLNNDNASITTIEHPTSANPTLTNTSLENANSVIPSLNHYRPAALTIDSEGSIWTHASLNAFKLVDNDFATAYIAQPTLGVSGSGLRSEISVYPNPTSSELFVKTIKQKSDYTIFDITGKQISFGALSEVKNNINVSNLSNGFYILNIKQENIIYNYKFLKSH